GDRGAGGRERHRAQLLGVVRMLVVGRGAAGVEQPEQTTSGEDRQTREMVHDALLPVDLRPIVGPSTKQVWRLRFASPALALRPLAPPAARGTRLRAGRPACTAAPAPGCA